ncbi:MAG: hypothetical protein KA354_05515 [Phycisphaerae bacterium]|nr:hypothetical protein [Phycisphaerae bacterium]
MRYHLTVSVGAFALSWPASPAAASIMIELLPGQAEVGCAEIHGVAAGECDLSAWQSRTLNFMADLRTPLMTPRLAGTFRNIDAPSPVQVPGGWQLFYGAWDGVPTGNDRIDSLLPSRPCITSTGLPGRTGSTFSTTEPAWPPVTCSMT